MHDDLTKRRLAHNERAFRDLNQALRGVKLVDADKLFAFRCECGLLSCNELIQMTAAEYALVRVTAAQFAIVDGHEDLELEHVSSRHRAYTVITKDGVAKVTAEQGES